MLCLVLAASAAWAWNLHILSVHHKAGDNCQVCAVAAAPELNADCGSDLLVRPDSSIAVRASLPGLLSEIPFIAAFLGRAPPL